MFSIRLIGGQALGYTRLNENRIYINPRAILHRYQYGRDVVEGLILHEFGHHVWHRGPKEEEIWKRADRQGIGRLLNLVADEHLERNLRAMDQTYGDKLKRLGAYAFQHTDKSDNYRCLGANIKAGWQFNVLPHAGMLPGRNPTR